MEHLADSLLLAKQQILGHIEGILRESIDSIELGNSEKFEYLGDPLRLKLTLDQLGYLEKNRALRLEVGGLRQELGRQEKERQETEETFQRLKEQLACKEEEAESLGQKIDFLESKIDQLEQGCESLQVELAKVREQKDQLTNTKNEVESLKQLAVRTLAL